MKSPESNWRSWVAKAENDLLNVRNNLTADEVPWDTVCFHAQQAAEKMLKALLLHRGVPAPRTHDLAALLEQCVMQDERAEALRGSCLLLNPYSVDARYPAAFPEPDEREARQAVEAARRISDAIVGWLPARRDGGGERPRHR
jgi:HEPN domain-containing protein